MRAQREWGKRRKRKEKTGQNNGVVKERGKGDRKGEKVAKTDNAHYVIRHGLFSHPARERSSKHERSKRRNEQRRQYGRAKGP